LAALWPGPGLVLATGLIAPPQDAFGAAHVIALTVTVQQAHDAQAFIWQTLESPAPYATGPYEGSVYFAATAKYSAFHTCNTWAAEALAAAGLPIRRAGVIFAGQLWAQVRRLPGAVLPHPPGAVESDVRYHGGQSDDAGDHAHDFLGAHGAPLRIFRVVDQQGGLLPFWQTTVVPEF
jgi:hypothetical protein